MGFEGEIGIFGGSLFWVGWDFGVFMLGDWYNMGFVVGWVCFVLWVVCFGCWVVVFGCFWCWGCLFCSCGLGLRFGF